MQENFTCTKFLSLSLPTQKHYPQEACITYIYMWVLHVVIITEGQVCSHGVYFLVGEQRLKRPHTGALLIMNRLIPCMCIVCSYVKGRLKRATK